MFLKPECAPSYWRIYDPQQITNCLACPPVTWELNIIPVSGKKKVKNKMTAFK